MLDEICGQGSRRLQAKNRELLVRVDTGIRSRRRDEANFFVEKLRDRPLETVLHRVSMGLTLPTEEIGALVAKFEAVAWAHVLPQKGPLGG